MKIKDYLTDESKWCQGSFHENGAICLSYGLNKFHGALLYSTLYELVVETIKRKFPETADKFTDICEWNDLPETTFDQVMEVCEELDI